MTEVDQTPSDDIIRRPGRGRPGRATRTGMGAAALQRAITDHLRYSLGRPPAPGGPSTTTVRWRLRCATACRAAGSPRPKPLSIGSKVACYLSAEFLLGPQLGNNLLNLDIEQAARDALAAMGQDLDDGAGVRGGSRAWATAASAGSPRATSTRWRRSSVRRSATASATNSASSSRRSTTAGRSSTPTSGSPTATLGRSPSPTSPTSSSGAATRAVQRRRRRRPGPVGARAGCQGHRLRHAIQGYGVNTCNMLTLWSARAVESFDFEAFNTGDYYKAVEERLTSETVTKVLYPNDEPEAGKRAAPAAAVLLRLLFAAARAAHLHDLADVSNARNSRSSSRCSSTTLTRRSASPS